MYHNTVSAFSTGRCRTTNAGGGGWTGSAPASEAHQLAAIRTDLDAGVAPPPVLVMLMAETAAWREVQRQTGQLRECVRISGRRSRLSCGASHLVDVPVPRY